MISDDRLRWLSSPDYIRSEPGQIAAELLAARERIKALGAALQLIGNELSLHADQGLAGETFRALLNQTFAKETKSCE
jgi:hypothetical protein